MCTYYQLHQHHQPPCKKDIHYELHYSYCIHAGIDYEGNRTPCANAYFDAHQNADYNDPCAMGDCTTYPGCLSGQCQLEELNGAWVCCKCRRGGNVGTWCEHKKRSSPDTYCYHVCCKNCMPDEVAISMSMNGMPITTSIGY